MNIILKIISDRKVKSTSFEFLSNGVTENISKSIDFRLGKIDKHLKLQFFLNLRAYCELCPSVTYFCLNFRGLSRSHYSSCLTADHLLCQNCFFFAFWVNHSYSHGIFLKLNIMGNAQASHADHHRRHSGGRGGQGGIILPNDKAPGFGNRETSPYEPVSITAVTKFC